MAATPVTYSFMDVLASITGIGGAFSLGYGSGVGEEGITIEMMEDKDTLTIGADGSGMHSLHAGNGGSITVRLLKSSPTNSLLQTMYDLQTLSSSAWGANVIVVSNVATNDITTCAGVAFKKKPNLTYAKEGGMNEWAFNAISVLTILG